MIYKHQHFVLDSESRKVFDENNKELRLTGNAYRMLVFLCENSNANLTEIGDHFDWVKDYTENHIRQYRYKINTIIGSDVVEYKNAVYSLVGDVKELEKMERNTDLLQENSVKSRKSIMEKIESIKFTIIPAIIASILLLLSFFDWPYGYYTFLRVVVTIVAVYYIYWLYTKTKLQNIWFWGLVIIGILFNPIVPIQLDEKIIWSFFPFLISIKKLALILLNTDNTTL
ncbi:hypothetical protein KJ841_01220 [Patescibacteria group bacterium]|nr:hypothetical protein [Patescibacteria group bacterium]